MAFMIFLFFFFYFTTTNNVFEFFRSNTVPLFYCSSGMFEILQIIFLVAFYNHHKSVVIHQRNFVFIKIVIPPILHYSIYYLFHEATTSS